MNSRLKDLAILGTLAAAGALLVAFLIVRGGRAGGSALAAVPEDAFLVVSVDVRALGASPLAEVVLGKGTNRAALLGVDAITESCGFNPLFRLREIVAAVPEGGERGDFGIAAVGDMTKDELTVCAKTLIAKRGGTPAESRVGSFTVVSDAQIAVSDASPRLAFRDGGPFLVGRGAWLTRMIDTAEGRVPSIAKSAAHASLRHALASRDPRTSAVVATALLPKSLRDRLRGEMEREAGDPSARGAQAMAGVLGVASAGLALHAGTKAGDDSALVAELRCETAAACVEVKKLLEKTRFGWSRDFGVRLVGLGPLVDNFTVDARGASLAIATHGPTPELARALERALDRGPSRAPSPTPSASSAPAQDVTPAPPRKADEVVHAGSSDASAPALRREIEPNSAKTAPSPTHPARGAMTPR